MNADPREGIVTEPTMYEVVRRLDDVTRRLDTLVTNLEEKYVPRREYDQRIATIEDDVKENAEARKQAAKDQSAFRRQVLGGLIVGAVLLLAQIIISLAGTPGVGS